MGKHIVIDEDLKEIVPGYVENRHKEIITLNELLKDQNIIEIKVIAHKLAGNAGGYGFHELGELGADLEAACESGDLDKMSELLNSISSYLDELSYSFEKVG